MSGIIRKLTSLAIAFTVVCLVAASFPQFHVVIPSPVMANPGSVNVVPNAKHANDNTGDTLAAITADDATENPDTLGAMSTTDNVYSIAKGGRMQFTTFDVSSIPVDATITAAVLHLQYGAQDGYGGSTFVRYDNGAGLTDSTIQPTDITGWSPDLTFNLYAAGVDTRSEIQNVDIEFFNGTPTANRYIHFDYIWITVTYTIAVDRSVSQGITITDGVTAAAGRGRNVSQGITVSDGVTAGIERARDASQGITISVGVTAVAASTRNVSQGITISDGVTAEPVILRDVAQGITISDGAVVIAGSGKIVVQGITISDGVTVVAGSGGMSARG